ncbi:PREDICTED: uncharacterized protein LOC108617247 isoform X3 [Drosophila arizonae]|uniref:Uncharacterized protein LOC108617247 isoform X3 n=1 Tax=Drosophila arizonae TaxID=7263 RepID=A0ABM1PMM3_DROAR|nr:PREDICTED: uncharacterized protein LOC108617247 isoform X3 [Drosophila arizonae]
MLAAASPAVLLALTRLHHMNRPNHYLNHYPNKLNPLKHQHCTALVNAPTTLQISLHFMCRTISLAIMLSIHYCAILIHTHIRTIYKSDVDEWPCRGGGADALRQSLSIVTVVVALIIACGL